MSVKQTREPLASPLSPPAYAIAVARMLAASGRPWFWLDGEADGWSYLGAATEVRTAVPGREREFLDELRAADHVLGSPPEARFRSDTAPAPGSTPEPLSAALENPSPDLEALAGEDSIRGGFHSGWVTVFGYEFGVALLGLEPARDDAAPAFALRTSAVLAIDHTSGRAELRGANAEQIDAWAAELQAASPGGSTWERESSPVRVPPDRHDAPERRVASQLREALVVREIPSGLEVSDDASWRCSDDEYLARIDACKEAIADGEAYVLCLTDTATALGNLDPLELYERLRGSGAATRGGVIVAGERALVSASPERFLSARRTRHGRRTVTTHPIKGTRPRGATPEADTAFAAALAADPKERAENLMIVDLMRNDLSRVCEPGTVRVDGFLRVETYPHVHQLVSTVSGTLRAGAGGAESSGADVFEAITACFPGGSMTGAPKHRAVEILSALEQGPRGLYSGCFGWIDSGGDAELAMTIRSVELRRALDDAEGTGHAEDSENTGGTEEAEAARGTGRSGAPGEAERAGRLWETRVGAGGGITADSFPAQELAEKHLKAMPLLSLLGEHRLPR